MARVKLKDVVMRVKDKVDKDATELEFYVGGEHIDGNEICVTKKGRIQDSTIGPAFHMAFKSGDVLLMSRNPHLRKASMVDFDGICSDVSYVCRTRDDDVLLQSYLPFLLQSDGFWRFAEENKKGGLPFFLNWSDFEKYEFDLPSIEKQGELSALLWAMQRTKQAYQELLIKTDELVKSQFIEMFGDPEKNPKGWDYIKLGDISFITKLAGFEYTKYIQYQDEGDIIMIRGLNCKGTKLILDDIKWIDKETSDMLPRSKLFKGDIVITYVGTVGEIGLIDKDDSYHLAPNVAKLSLNDKEKNNPMFWAYMLMASRDYVIRFATSTTQAALNMDKIRKIGFINPPVELQNKFVAFLEQSDKSKFELKKNIENINALMKSLIQQDFS
jgi:type I restriction enzyme S subunit